MKNLHNVPQVVIDVAENLVNTKQENMRTNYMMRLEAIRDYCDAVLKQQNTKSIFNIPAKRKTTVK